MRPQQGFIQSTGDRARTGYNTSVFAHGQNVTYIIGILQDLGYDGIGLINAEFNTDDLEVDECQLAQQTFEHLHRPR